MASNYPKLEPGQFAHVYNRAVGRDELFLSDKDFKKFLDEFREELAPVAEIHAYCFLINHYHLLVRLKETTNHEKFTASMNRIQSRYAKGFNWKNERKGSLFMRPFKRKPIRDDAHLAYIVWYIHRNPLHHRFTKDWARWPYSSYPVYDRMKRSFLVTKYLLTFFGGLEQFRFFHQENTDGYLNDDPGLNLE